jgi:hypothetical protein
MKLTPRPPAAARDLDDCLGVSTSICKAPAIPKRCQAKADALEACVQAHQALAQERTGRCSGPQRVD